MLRLVHPAPAGQGTDPPGARRRRRHAAALSLSAEEIQHLRATIRNTARAYGSLGCLAAVIGVPASTLTPRRKRPSPGLALAVARAAGMSVEAVLGGALSSLGRCSACGSRVGDRPALSVAGGAR
jgi:hypothetical protein